MNPTFRSSRYAFLFPFSIYEVHQNNTTSNNRINIIKMNARRAKVKHMKTCQSAEHETVDWNTIVSLYNKTVMDILLSKYNVIFTEFQSIDFGPTSVNTVQISKYHTILLSKRSTIVYYESVSKFDFTVEMYHSKCSHIAKGWFLKSFSSYNIVFITCMFR